MFSSPCSLLWSFLSLVLSWSQLPLTYCFISALFLPFHSCPLSLFQPCLLGLFIIFCPYSFPVLIYFLFVFWIFPCDQPVFVLPFPSYLVMDSPVLDSNAEDTVNAYMRMERHQESKKQDNSIPDAQYVYNTLNQEFRQSREAWAKLVPTFKYKAKLLRKLLQSAVISLGNWPCEWCCPVGLVFAGGCYVDGVYFASRGFYEVHLMDGIHK